MPTHTCTYAVTLVSPNLFVIWVVMRDTSKDQVQDDLLQFVNLTEKVTWRQQRRMSYCILWGCSCSHTMQHSLSITKSLLKWNSIRAKQEIIHLWSTCNPKAACQSCKKVLACLNSDEEKDHKRAREGMKSNYQKYHILIYLLKQKTILQYNMYNKTKVYTYMYHTHTYFKAIILEEVRCVMARMKDKLSVYSKTTNNLSIYHVLKKLL